MAPVIVVTGGSRGIGAATAVRAARAGYDVAVTYRASGERAEAVAERCRELGRRALAVQADVADDGDVRALFALVEATWGRLDALVANAGIVAPQGRLESFSAERITRMLAVNVLGPMLCAREAIRRMSMAHGGHGGAVVFVSSAASRLGSANQYVDYAASKGAIDTLTIGLAGEVAADGIRVNTVRPGIIDTEIHADGGEPDRAARLAPTLPLGRPGTADEVAHAICWLLSAEASYVTGAIVDVAGGR